MFYQFYDWNPTVGADCTNLVAGTYYCVSTYADGVPPPVPHTLTDATTTTSGDGCAAIATEYAISLSTFYSRNPAVGSSCQDLEAGVYVCVGVISSTISATTTSSATGVQTPSPVQTGIVSGCDLFYEVYFGDTCYAITET
ncbi:hypothetical protein BX600DRAFT_513528 [Xylariales sp. PMI_506]|nr:hypothetical protein BX600DRAFT_513528 [Xylariales sp. PMI_506]